MQLGELEDRYRMGDLLGEGRFSRVYAARLLDAQDATPVFALKQMGLDTAQHIEPRWGFDNG